MVLEWVIVVAIVISAAFLLGRRGKPRCGAGCDHCPAGKAREIPDD